MKEAETSTLGKYFTFFTRLLTRAKSDPNTPRSKADMSVMALSNLLSANIDSALEYFITMGYHEDLETRASFLKVLTNILNQVLLSLLSEDVCQVLYSERLHSPLQTRERNSILSLRRATDMTNYSICCLIRSSRSCWHSAT